MPTAPPPFYVNSIILEPLFPISRPKFSCRVPFEPGERVEVGRGAKGDFIFNKSRLTVACSCEPINLAKTVGQNVGFALLASMYDLVSFYPTLSCYTIRLMHRYTCVNKTHGFQLVGQMINFTVNMDNVTAPLPLKQQLHMRQHRFAFSVQRLTASLTGHQQLATIIANFGHFHLDLPANVNKFSPHVGAVSVPFLLLLFITLYMEHTPYVGHYCLNHLKQVTHSPR